jgi:hypothetical protein
MTGPGCFFAQVVDETPEYRRLSAPMDKGRDTTLLPKTLRILSQQASSTWE